MPASPPSSAAGPAAARKLLGQTSRMHASQQPAWLCSVLRGVLEPGVLAQLSNGQLAALLTAMAQARLSLLKDQAPAIHQQLRVRAPYMTAAQLAGCCHALARLRSALPSKVLFCLLACFAARLPAARPQECAQLVAALPHISCRYTQYLTTQQQPLLKACADFTLPHLHAIVRAAQIAEASGNAHPAARSRELIVGSLRHPAELPRQPSPVSRFSGAQGSADVMHRTASQAASSSLAGERLDRFGTLQLVQLGVGFTRIGYYPGAIWMRAHRAACLALEHRFSAAEKAQLRAAYQTLLNM
ncbi:hypothetical protein V8C86DRAFT_2873485 [Haematococcus lacustris]